MGDKKEVRAVAGRELRRKRKGWMEKGRKEGRKEGGE